MLTLQSKYRGKTGRLLAICECFKDHGPTGLHPTQIARKTGMSMIDVARQLDATPELFVKLLRRGDVRRYRLSSAVSQLDMEEIEEFVMTKAKYESILLYAGGAMVLCAFAITIMLLTPALDAS